MQERKKYYKRRNPVKYPDKRKKKRVHTQFMSYNRVIENWKVIPELRYIYRFDDGVYLCEETESVSDADFLVDDVPYRRLWQDDRYSEGSGDAVYAYVGIIDQSHMGIHNGRVVYMETPVQRAFRDFSRLLNIKKKEYIPLHIQYKIW